MALLTPVAAAPSAGSPVDFSVLSLHECVSCHKSVREYQIERCTRCKEVIYCGQECRAKDWEAHKLRCKDLVVDTTTSYTKDNETVREFYSHFEATILKRPNLPAIYDYLKDKKYNHVLQTQQSILEGSAHLNPESSIVVVVGAQFYDDKFVEPLPQLLEKCKKLILIDIDPVTLGKLHAMLGNNPKVFTVVLDLTCTLEDLQAFNRDFSKSSQLVFFAGLVDFLNKVAEDTEKRVAGLPGVLGEGESADYVISSLVASQLSRKLIEGLLFLFLKKFGFNISPVTTPQLKDTLNKARDESSHALATKHAKDLCAWAGEKGRVYLADTYKWNKVVYIHQKTSDELMQILRNRKGAPKVTQKEWHWRTNFWNDYSVTSLLS